MRIGIAGMGKMGGAIAARLRETGAEVIVWNRFMEPSCRGHLTVRGALLPGTNQNGVSAKHSA
jgi:3-hydroxyisobutyrate dehydrogenase-like beta-hydroxyacid dehydrogenase